jgi:4-carboxymuconolactone decarboxylase
MQKRAVLMFVGCTLSILTPLKTGATSAIPDRPGRTQPVALTSPRMAPVPEAQWTGAQREVAAKYSRGGRADNALKTLLNVPEVVEALMPFTNYLTDESTLSPRHRELLMLRTAWLCGNQFLWAAHTAVGRKIPLTDGEIRRIAQGPDVPGWDPFEATLLRMADQLYRNSFVNDAIWKTLAAKYDVPQLIDAVETVNHFTILSLLYNSLGVQPDEMASDRLPTNVAYRVVVPDREPPLKVARIEPVPGTGLAVGRTFARHPKPDPLRGRRPNYINRVSPLAPRHREMLILRIGWDCQAEYEWEQHVGTVGHVRDLGLDPVRIAQGPDAPGWDAFEAVLLRAVDELYRDAMVSDRTWKALAAGFDTKSLMGALFTPSSYRATSTSLSTYGVQLEAGTERFPKLP